MRAVKELRWADPVLLTVLFLCLSSQLVRAGVEGLQGHWKGVLLFEGGHEADLLIGFGEAEKGRTELRGEPGPRALLRNVRSVLQAPNDRRTESGALRVFDRLRPG